MVIRIAFMIGLLLTGTPSAAVAQRLLNDGIQELASQVAARASEEQKLRVAVVPFRELDGRQTVLGSYLAESLTTRLFNVPRLRVVERTMLDKVMAELKLASTGAIDPSTAARIGKLLGVDAIVTGSVTDMQSSVAVNCRMIDAATGEVFGAAEVRIVKDDDLRAILGRALGGVESRSASPPSSTAAALPPTQSRTMKGVTIEMSACARSARTVTCSLTITNKDRDRDFDLEQAKAFDQGGVELTSSRLALAGKGGETISYARLISGVPTKAAVIFEDVSQQVAQLTAVYVMTFIRDPATGISVGGPDRFEFRNIPVIESR